MKAPNWAKVLNVLYNEEDSLYREFEGGLSETHDLVTKSGLDSDRVEDALVFLRDQGLVEQSSAGNKRAQTGELQSTHIEYALTQKGFEVAHNREMNLRQEKHDRVISAFTVFLGLSAIFQAWTIIQTRGWLLSAMVGIFSIFGAITFLFVIRGRVGFLTG